MHIFVGCRSSFDIFQSLSTGVRLLEENLIQNTGEEERASKRARMTAAEPTEEISTWIELARYTIVMARHGGKYGRNCTFMMQEIQRLDFGSQHCSL